MSRYLYDTNLFPLTTISVAAANGLVGKTETSVANSRERPAAAVLGCETKLRALQGASAVFQKNVH